MRNESRENGENFYLLWVLGAFLKSGDFVVRIFRRVVSVTSVITYVFKIQNTDALTQNPR